MNTLLLIQRDWSDAIWLLVGMCIIFLVNQVLLYAFNEHAKDKEIRRMFRTEEQRKNKQVMNALEEACQYDERQIS